MSSIISTDEMDTMPSIHEQTDLTVVLSKLVLETSIDHNVFFSPLSITVALSMVLACSKGPILQQFLTFLKLENGPQLHEFYSQHLNVVLINGSANGGPNLLFVNGVWVDKSM